MLGTDNFNWKDNGMVLYRGKSKTGFSVAQSMEEPGMFRVLWPDKTPSKDYYNLSRAKNHCISEASIHFNMLENGTAEAVDAFK